MSGVTGTSCGYQNWPTPSHACVKKELLATGACGLPQLRQRSAVPPTKQQNQQCPTAMLGGCTDSWPEVLRLSRSASPKEGPHTRL